MSLILVGDFMKKLVIGNWKMQKLSSEIHPYFHPFMNKSFHNVDLALAVPYLFLQSCQEAHNGTPFKIGAQDVSAHDNGAYTGEISAAQLASLKISFSLVGHSERRKNFHESSEIVAAKAKRLQNAGILPIVCVGETIEEKPHFQDVLKSQLEPVLSLDPKNLVIAYEPVWAIGTGMSASIDDIKRVHGFIKYFLKEHSYDFSSVRVLYGGSVSEKNASSLLQCDHVDGLLIGGASLDPVGFDKLIATLG
jgi:triosephosphate isomerase (TIM)